MNVRDILREKIAENRERRDALLARGEAFSVLAESRPERALTVEEEAEFKEIIAECKTLNEQVEEMRERLDHLGELEEATRAANQAAPFNIGGGLRPSGSPRTQVQGEALRSLELSHGRGLGDDATHEVITKVVERDTRGGMSKMLAAISTPEYFSAWAKRQSDEHGYQLWTDAERAAFQRVHELRTGYDHAGNLGTIIPALVAPEFVLTGAGSISPFRQVCNVVQIESGHTYRTPTMPELSGGWFTPGDESTDDGTQIVAADVPIESARVMAIATWEYLADLPQLSNVLGRAFADSLANLECAAFTTGSGTPPEPEGIVTALTGSASEINSAGESIAASDFYGLVEALPARHRQNAKWMMNIAICNDLRQLDTAGGAALLAYLGDGPVERLMGFALHENSQMDGTWAANATANNYVAIFGDWSNAVIVDSGFSTLHSIELLATANNLPSGKRAMMLHKRTGFKCINEDAFRMLDLATTA